MVGASGLLDPPGRPAGPPALGLSDLVDRTGVPASTIHHYRRAGLLPPPQRLAANRFGYGEGHVRAVRAIRRLRDVQGLSLDDIGRMLPDVLAGPQPDDDPTGPCAEDVRRRVVAAATGEFRTQSYGEVTVGAVAEAAGVAKGSVYRYFTSKEDLFTAVVESLLVDTAASFAVAIDDLGGASGVSGDPVAAAEAFARLVAGAMPILLELGARAAKGHGPSQELARRVLRTLAEAAGRPLVSGPASAPGPAPGPSTAPGTGPSDDGAVPAGLGVIEAAFATVLAWAVAPTWPPRTAPRS